ncbi:MAG: hypothetical protein V7603_5054 [Micromonosporaceae bacterium]
MSTAAPTSSAAPAPAATMYCFRFGNQWYDAHRGGRPLGLGDCLDATYGVASAAIYRVEADDTLTLLVDDAGNSREIVHAPTGRRIRRRRPFASTRPTVRAA